MDSMKADKGEEDIWKANEDLGPLKDGGEKGVQRTPERLVSQSGKMLKGVLGVLLVA